MLYLDSPARGPIDTKKISKPGRLVRQLPGGKKNVCPVLEESMIIPLLFGTPVFLTWC